MDAYRSRAGPRDCRRLESRALTARAGGWTTPPLCWLHSNLLAGGTMPDQGAVPVSRPAVAVDRATVRDVEAIHRLVNFWAARGDMLPRTMGETYENLRDF